MKNDEQQTHSEALATHAGGNHRTESADLGTFPRPSFEVTDDPEDREGVLLMPMVDIEDRGPVMDVIIDRLVEMQAEEQLPIVVMIVRPEARNEAILRSMGNSAP